MNSSDRRRFDRAVKSEVEKRVLDHTPSNNPAVTTLAKAPSMLTRFRQLGMIGWSLLAAVITLTGLLVFRSDVTIAPRVRLDPQDPFSTLYTVTNEGFFPIKDVQFSCRMNDAEIHNYMWAVKGESVTDPKSEPEIHARKSQDVVCLFGVAGNQLKPAPNAPPFEYRTADITLTVSYRPQFWLSRTQSERFIARTDGHGKIVEWSHQAG